MDAWRASAATAPPVRPWVSSSSYTLHSSEEAGCECHIYGVKQALDLNSQIEHNIHHFEVSGRRVSAKCRHVKLIALVRHLRHPQAPADSVNKNIETDFRPGDFSRSQDTGQRRKSGRQCWLQPGYPNCPQAFEKCLHRARDPMRYHYVGEAP